MAAGAAHAQTVPTTTGATIEVNGQYVSVLPSSTVQVQGVQLSRTGTDVAPYVITGTALAAGGAIVVLGARKRRNSLTGA
jgi:hypothetical protein